MSIPGLPAELLRVVSFRVKAILLKQKTNFPNGPMAIPDESPILYVMVEGQKKLVVCAMGSPMRDSELAHKSEWKTTQTTPSPVPDYDRPGAGADSELTSSAESLIISCSTTTLLYPQLPSSILHASQY